MNDSQTKIQVTHLRRNAYLYVRQSTPRQVLEHRESTERQYGLRQRALALGWQDEQIVVIDSDLGQSGASATERAGFQRLVSEVGLGHAGLVLGLEVSRLARNSSDWYRLLEICALTDTLLLDEDGLYHPGDFNDRLLLGLNNPRTDSTLSCISWDEAHDSVGGQPGLWSVRSPAPSLLATDHALGAGVLSERPGGFGSLEWDRSTDAATPLRVSPTRAAGGSPFSSRLT
jgi:hypothetical protein